MKDHEPKNPAIVDALETAKREHRGFTEYVSFKVDGRAPMTPERLAEIRGFLRGDTGGRWLNLNAEMWPAVHELLAEVDRLTADVRRLRSIMLAAATELTDHWDAHCDESGAGPVNLLRRLQEGTGEYAGVEGLRADLAEARAERDEARAVASRLATRFYRERAESPYRIPGVPVSPFDHACAECCVPPYADDTVVPGFRCDYHTATDWKQAP